MSLLAMMIAGPVDVELRLDYFDWSMAQRLQVSVSASKRFIFVARQGQIAVIEVIELEEYLEGRETVVAWTTKPLEVEIRSEVHSARRARYVARLYREETF